MSKHDPFDGRAERKARDYEVGYGKTPKRNRFKPGQSGNPSGRRKARPSYAALIRLELDKTVTIGRGDNSRTMTKRQVVGVRFRRAIANGNIEAFKLAMLIDEDDASEEPIGRETANRLFWAKERKKLMREMTREEAEARRSDPSSNSQPSDLGSPSSDGAVAVDPNEIADEEGDDEQA
jgi:Family of unknown function (DUF5681)